MPPSKTKASNDIISQTAPPDILAELVQIMERLRDTETGCPWDVAQDFDTIAPYTIEEAYEVADAIARKDMPALKDELGDLLLQVVFHSQMAKEAGHFTISDVIGAICSKMIRRHPHVFGDTDAAEWDWEGIKAAERADNGAQGALDGVAIALPALMRAQKLQKRAARTGFDWPDDDGAIAKLYEEIDELKAAKNEAERLDEAGDVLFSAVNIVRKMGISAEDALRSANAKFESRFKLMEREAAQNVTSRVFTDLSLEEKEALWQLAKQKLRG